MYQVSSDKNSTDKIKSFIDLLAWQKSHLLVVDVYKITLSFPINDQFGLTSQIRRSAVSITSNIAEGFSRSTKPDKTHFYTMALGSLTELQSQLLVARDVKYLNKDVCKELLDKTVLSQKLLHGLVKALREGKGVRHE